MLRVAKKVTLIALISSISVAQTYNTHAFQPYSQDEMFNITTEAAVKRPDVSLLLKNSEDWFWRKCKSVGLNQDTVAPVAALVAPIVAKKVSTRSAQLNLTSEKNVVIRPDVDYYFNTMQTQLALTFSWKF